MPLAVTKSRLMVATLLAIQLIWASDTRAAIITVGAGGGYNFATLAAAVAAANANDNIRIAAGTYLNDFVTINVPLTIEGGRDRGPLGRCIDPQRQGVPSDQRCRDHPKS